MAWQSLFTHTGIRPYAEVPFFAFQLFCTKRGKVHYKGALSLCALLSEMSGLWFIFWKVVTHIFSKREKGRERVGGSEKAGWERRRGEERQTRYDPWKIYLSVSTWTCSGLWPPSQWTFLPQFSLEHTERWVKNGPRLHWKQRWMNRGVARIFLMGIA